MGKSTKRWVPMVYGEGVEDTRRFSAVSIDIADDGKSLWVGDEDGVRTLEPPDNVRLCKLVEVADDMDVLRKAVQFASVVSDWYSGEVEIDGEMVSVYELLDEFKSALEGGS